MQESVDKLLVEIGDGERGEVLIQRLPRAAGGGGGAMHAARALSPDPDLAAYAAAADEARAALRLRFQVQFDLLAGVPAAFHFLEDEVEPLLAGGNGIPRHQASEQNGNR
jgi:hypothetical protein